jgi:diacylglycerol kinase
MKDKRSGIRISPMEWIACVLCISFVFFAEVLNTCIEKIMDIDHPERSDKVAVIKDMAALAVLFSATGALVTAAIIFIPKIFS